MRDDRYDNQIEGIFKNEIEIPNAVRNTILEMDYTIAMKKGRFSMKKFIPIIAVVILIMSATTAYATGLLDVLFQSDNRALNQALDRGYVQNIDMEYTKNPHISSKIESLVMDEGNIAIVFDHVLEEKIKGFDNISIQNLQITDEQDNILFCDGDTGSISQGYEYRYAMDGDNVIKLGLFLNSNSNRFPKSETLFISFTGVTFHLDSTEVRIYQGVWDYTIKVSSMFQETDKKDYNASGGNELTVLKAEASPTGLQVEFEIDYPLDAMGLRMKLVDELGNEYESTHGITADNESTRPLIHVIFEVSSFNADQQYTLVVDDTDSDREMRIALSQIE